MLDLIIPRVVVSDNTSIAQSYIIINIIVFVRTISVPFFISRVVTYTSTAYLLRMRIFTVKMPFLMTCHVDYERLFRVEIRILSKYA